MAFSFSAPATDFALGGFSHLSSPTPGGAYGCGWFGLDRIQIVVSKEHSAENNLLYGVWKGTPTNWILEDHEESTYDRMREVIVYDVNGVGIRFLATFDSQTDQYTYALPSSGSTGAATGSRAILLHYPQSVPNHVLYGGPPGAMESQGAWKYGFHLTGSGDGARALLSSIADPLGNVVIFGFDQGYRLVTPQLIGAQYRIDIDGGGVEYRNSHQTTNWISLGSAPPPDADCEGPEGVFGWNGRQGQTNEPYWVELDKGSSGGSNYTLITEGSGSSTSQVQQKWVWEAAKDVEKQLYAFAYGWTSGQQDALQRLQTFYLGEIPTSYQYQYDAVDVNGWTVNRGFKVTIKPGVSSPSSSTPRAAELFFDHGPTSQQPLGEFKTLRVKRPKLNEQSGNDLTVHSFQGGTAAFSQVSYYPDSNDDPEEYRWRRTTYFQFTDFSAPTKIVLSPDPSSNSDPREITFDYDAYVDQNWPSGVYETRLTGVTDPAGNEIVVHYGENHGDGPTGSKPNPPLLPSSIELVAVEGPDPQWRFDYTWSTSGTLTTPNGLLRGFSEPDRGWWELVYDDSNGAYPFKLRQIVDPTGRVAAVDAYDALGRSTLVKLFPSGTSGTPLWSETEYTLLGQPAESTTGFGSSAHSTTEFRWSGQFLTGVTDPRGHVASFYYNTQTALGKTGMLGEITIGTGQDEALYVKIVRDYLGRPWKIEGGNGVYVEYAYGHRDELLSTYCSGDPTDNKELFHYACCGLLEKWTRPDGQYVHFAYDGFGALSQVRFNAETGDPDEAFDYDTAGRLETAGNIAGASAFTYNQMGQLATETVESRDPSDGSAVATIAFESEYYPSGDLKKSIMKQGATVISTLEYVYDDAGRLETIKNGGSTFASYAYDGAGRLTAADAVIGTGATLYGTASYADSQLAGSLGSLGYKINSGSPFASFGYAYYADGALAEAADTVGSTSRSYEWDYNPDGSLQYETIGSATATFEYDAGGNLTAWGASTGWQYLHNRLTEVPSKGYEFYYAANGERSAWFQTPTMPTTSGYRLRADANGDDCVDDADLGIVLEFYGCETPWTGSCAGGQAADLNEDGLVDDTDLAWVSEDYGAFAWLYEYDVYGNLVYAGSPCAGEYETAYDAFGRRVWERIDPAGGSPVETHFVYDGDALVLELSPSGQPLVQYVWGLLGPIARVDLQNGANTRYYVLDARGHARAMVDSTGSVTDYYEHDAWGNLSPGSFGSTPNPFKWNAAAGYQHVPFTGLYHVGAREYDPRTARWLQRDPIGQSSGDPNLYRYCGNDAVNLSDPDGLQPPTSEYDPFEGVGLRLNENGSVARVSPLNNKGRRQARQAAAFVKTALELNPVSTVPKALGYCDSRLEQGLAAVSLVIPCIRYSILVRAPKLGDKIKFLLGQSKGAAENVARSLGNLKELQKIGLNPGKATEDLLSKHLTDVLNNPFNIASTSMGREIRESLLMGPNGGLKMISVWQGDSLITVILKGGN